MHDDTGKGRYTIYGADGAQHPSGSRRSGTRRQRLKVRRRRRRLVFLLLVLVALAVGGAVASGRLSLSGAAGDVQGSAPPAAPAGQPVNLTGDVRTKPTAGSQETVEPSPVTTASPGPKSVTVTGGGDVIGDRAVRNVLAQSGAGLFVGIAPVFKDSDFSFVNLETPLTDNGDPQTWKDVVFRGDPRLAPAMAESGISVVTLANNHGGDQGSQGLRDTLRHCRQSGIAVVGAGKDLARAQQAAVLEKDGVKAAFLGFTDVLPVGFSATPFSPGVSPGRSDPQAVRQAISAAASQAHFTFVAWHWNFEYTTAPGALETNEGRAAIDAGADVVFGHHPHVLQGIETYNGGLICYSLGNLVFDNCTGPRAETVLVTTRVSDTEIEAVLTPVRIASSGQPFVAEGAQARRILQSVKQYSAALGTTVRISGGKGYVRVTRQPA